MNDKGIIKDAIDFGMINGVSWPNHLVPINDEEALKKINELLLGPWPAPQENYVTVSERVFEMANKKGKCK